MKLALTIIVIVILAGSFYADCRWRKWMAARRREHDASDQERG